MGAPQPPPLGSPLSCGNARMLPLPAAPAHKCGRRAKGACKAGERRGNRASRARARRDASPEGDGRRARPPGGERGSMGRVNPSPRRSALSSVLLPRPHVCACARSGFQGNCARRADPRPRTARADVREFPRSLPADAAEGGAEAGQGRSSGPLSCPTLGKHRQSVFAECLFNPLPNTLRNGQCC